MKKLFLAGDSTVAPYHDTENYYALCGYGEQLSYYLRGIAVINLALNGRSSKSFASESAYRVLTEELGEGDFLSIDFCHNDEKADAARHTDPKGEGPGSFFASLKERYLDLARSRGAFPILCTPTVRRPEGAWTDAKLHITAEGDYPAAIRRLAAATHTPLVDLTARTKALYDALPPEQTALLHRWNSASADSVDNTHFNAYGARVIAGLWAEELAGTDSPLVPHLRRLHARADFRELVVVNARAAQKAEDADRET